MKVFFVINTNKVEATELAGKTVKYLLDKGHDPVLLAKEANIIGMPDFSDSSENSADIGLVVVFGGDGTILRATREVNCFNAPVLGINIGTLGFMATVQPVNLMPSLERFFSNDYQVVSRRPIDWKMEKEGKEVARGMALNDVVVSKYGYNRIINCHLEINGRELFSYMTDGLIIASPTGSTAYSLSAGGPLVSPNSDVVIVTPVSPHSLFSRSLVVSGEDTVAVNLYEKAALSADGLEIIGDFETVTASLSKNKIDFVDFSGHSFFDSLNKKLNINEPF